MSFHKNSNVKIYALCNLWLHIPVYMIILHWVQEFGFLQSLTPNLEPTLKTITVEERIANSLHSMLIMRLNKNPWNFHCLTYLITYLLNILRNFTKMHIDATDMTTDTNHDHMFCYLVEVIFLLDNDSCKVVAMEREDRDVNSLHYHYHKGSQLKWQLLTKQFIRI